MFCSSLIFGTLDVKNSVPLRPAGPLANLRVKPAGWLSPAIKITSAGLSKCSVSGTGAKLILDMANQLLCHLWFRYKIPVKRNRLNQRFFQITQIRAPMARPPCYKIPARKETC
jgi:hypothetical protein